MKQKTFGMLLWIEAGVCVLLGFLRASFTGVFSAAMAFPFEQIGQGLRALSLSGAVGNAAAILLYVGICLIPAAAMPILQKKRGLYRDDWLLALLSITLFVVVYLMINPGALGPLLGGTTGLGVGKAALGVTVWSVLCGYLILRLLRLFFLERRDKLQKYMVLLLRLLSLLFVYMAFGACLSKLLDSLASVQAGNVGNEHLLGTTYFFLGLQYAVDALPYLLDVFVVLAAVRLLEALSADRYSPQSVKAAGELSRLCGKALAATVLSDIAFNLLQILFAKSLMVLNTTLNIPVFSIAFVLGVLLVTRFIAENKQLKDDNDMFI